MRALAAVLLLALIQCTSRASPAAAGPRVVVETAAGARHVVTVEVARTDAERMKGLMNRAELGADAGMLFLFDETARHEFWMRNTLIPLDMIFISDDGRITGIVSRAVPGDLTPRSAGGPSRYVLEVNGGWAEKRGVKVGDRVRFEGISRF